MSVATPPSAEAALLYCRRLTRARARNFYYGLKLLPEPKRSALYAIYAWMRRADDLADDADDVDLARIRLTELRRATDAALGGEAPDDDPVLVSLRSVASQFDVDPSLLHEMLDGQAADLAARRYETFDELREYCHHVASTVGLICISIWGYTSDRAPALAADLGVAFQLTNILRDLAQDDDAGRVYLPTQELERHGLEMAQLRRGEPREACTAFLREQMDRAEQFYQRAEPLEGMITPSCRSTLWAMRTIYHRLLQKMMADPLAVMREQRIRLSAVEKGSIALRARWGRGNARGQGG